MSEVEKLAKLVCELILAFCFGAGLVFLIITAALVFSAL